MLELEPVLALELVLEPVLAPVPVPVLVLQHYAFAFVRGIVAIIFADLEEAD